MHYLLCGHITWGCRPTLHIRISCHVTIRQCIMLLQRRTWYRTSYFHARYADCQTSDLCTHHHYKTCNNVKVLLPVAIFRVCYMTCVSTVWHIKPGCKHFQVWFTLKTKLALKLFGSIQVLFFCQLFYNSSGWTHRYSYQWWVFAIHKIALQGACRQFKGAMSTFLMLLYKAQKTHLY